MLQALRQQWRQLAADRVGQRFQNYYRREHGGRQGGRRVWKWVVGVALLVVGIALLFVPGPGSVLIVIGAAFLAGESRSVARWLDAGEIQSRRILSRAWQAWRHASSPAKVLLVSGLTAVVGLIGWSAYSFLT